MELRYKPDWEVTKRRYEAWWAHDNTGRCLLTVTAPRAGLMPEERPKPPDDVEARWFDKDYLRAVNDYGMRRTFYGAEALPIWNAGYPGWAFIPVYLGAPVTLDTATGWVDPLINKGALTDYDYREFTIPPDNRWWVKAQEMLRFGAEEAKGKCVATIGAFGGAGDTLAALRGNTELLMDLVDCPDYVREFDTHLMRIWIEVHKACYEIIEDTTEGSTGWFPLWSPGRFYASQNDFAYMISPKMFREVFLPVIELQTNYLDHCVHHVDGIGNFAHVDALLELPRLQALQILPGAGKPSPLHYMDLLKKVQKAGKNLHISLAPGEVEAALNELSARGLCIATSCSTEEAARELIKNCEKWSRDR